MTAAIVLGIALAPCASAGAKLKSPTHWLGAWNAAPSDASSASRRLAGQTVRIVLTPLGASKPIMSRGRTRRSAAAARVRFTNVFGTQAITIDSAAISKVISGASVGSIHPLSFGGQPSVTIPAGAEAISDPLRFEFHALQRLAVSAYVDPGSTETATEHYDGGQTSYIAPGDQALTPSGAPFTDTTTQRFLVSEVDVRAARQKRAVVAFGDSITEGFQGLNSLVVPNPVGIDQDARYPDFLAHRILQSKKLRNRYTVLNAGISGNRVLRDGFFPQVGPSALSRIGRDVFALSGASTVIVLEGINDIGLTQATAPQLIAGLQQLVSDLKAGGHRVLLGTLTPAGGCSLPTYGSPEANSIRIEVNNWIRSQSLSDGVIDFDAALRDPADPSRLLPAYDSSDHVHPNATGYQAMARAVPLKQLSAKKNRRHSH